MSKPASRFAISGASILVLLVGIALPAGATPVSVQGAMSCALSATVRFSRPLINGGTRPTKVTVNGTLTNCTDTTHQTTPGPGGISGGTLRASFMLPNNSCESATDESSPNLLGKIAWTPSSTMAAPTVFSQGVGLLSFSSLSGVVVGFDAPSPSGSFALNVLMLGYTTMTSDEFAAACSPKNADIPGSGGLRHFTTAPPTILGATSCSPGLCP